MPGVEFTVRVKTYVHPIEVKRINAAIRAMLELKFVPEVVEIEGKKIED